MTDLERAQWAIRGEPETWIPMIVMHLAAARREGAEAALEEAAQRCDKLATDYTIPISADNWSAGCRGCAGRIRALKER